jgi:hypothetical protein
MGNFIGEIQEVNRLIIEKSEIDITLRMYLPRTPGPEKQYELQGLLLEQKGQLFLDFIRGIGFRAHDGPIFSYPKGKCKQFDLTNSSLCRSQALNKTAELSNGNPATVRPSLFNKFIKVKRSRGFQNDARANSKALPPPLSRDQKAFLKIIPQFFSGRKMTKD